MGKRQGIKGVLRDLGGFSFWFWGIEIIIGQPGADIASPALLAAAANNTMYHHRHLLLLFLLVLLLVPLLLFPLQCCRCSHAISACSYSQSSGLTFVYTQQTAPHSFSLSSSSFLTGCLCYGCPNQRPP